MSSFLKKRWISIESNRRTRTSLMETGKSITLEMSISIVLTKDLINPSLGKSSHASSQLQSLEGFHHSYLVSAIEGNENRENIHYHRGSQQSMNKNLGNKCVTLQPSTCDPDSVGKLHFSGSEFESPCDIDGIDSVVPAELGSSNVRESSTKNSCLDDISLETATFLQLQLLMDQIEKPWQRHGDRLEHNETYCGSCYGAETCKREGFVQKVQEEQGEGCSIHV